MSFGSLSASLNCRFLLVNYSESSTLDGLPTLAKELFQMEAKANIDEVTIYAPYPKGRNKGSDLSLADCAMQIRCRTFYDLPVPRISYDPMEFNRGRSILIRVQGDLQSLLSSLKSPVTVETLRQHSEVDVLQALKKAAFHFENKLRSNLSKQMKTRVGWFSECIKKH